MSKKEKAVFSLADNFQAMIEIVPKLNAFVKAHKEIADGYQKYRKNGGEAISGIEKHLGIKEQSVPTPLQAKKTASTKEPELSEIVPETKKAKKKAKK